MKLDIIKYCNEWFKTHPDQTMDTTVLIANDYNALSLITVILEKIRSEEYAIFYINTNNTLLLAAVVNLLNNNNNNNCIINPNGDLLAVCRQKDIHRVLCIDPLFTFSDDCIKTIHWTS